MRSTLARVLVTHEHALALGMSWESACNDFATDRKYLEASRRHVIGSLPNTGLSQSVPVDYNSTAKVPQYSLRL